MDNDEILKILQDRFVNKRESANKMSRELKIPYRRILKIIKDNDLKQNKPYQDYDWFFEKFVLNGMDYIDIAKKYGFSKRVVEDWSMRHGINFNTRRDKFIPTKEQLSVILGGVLGDGCISKRNDIDFTQFIHVQSEERKEYEMWIHSILKNMCASSPSFTEGGYKNIKNKHGVSTPYYCKGLWRTATRGYKFLDKYKNISFKDCLKELDDISLSIWVLDDGCKSDKVWSLCMGEITLENSLYFVDFFKKKYIDAHITIYEHKSYSGKKIPYVKFGVEASKVLDNIILKTIPNDIDVVKTKVISNKKRRK